MLSHKNCPLCGSKAIELLYDCRDYLVSGESFPLQRCQSCTFIFTGKIPDEKEAGRYYRSEDYISHSDTGKGFVNKAYHIVRRMMLAAKFRMLKKDSGLDRAAVVDIGSGTGYFPLYLKSKGWQCTGIEISDEAREFAARVHNTDLLAAGDSKSIVSDSADIVSMWHTFEHFYDPEGYLRESLRILKKNGLLVMALPNHKSYDAKNYGHYWAGWDVPRHLWHFNPDTIRKMAGKHGLKLQSVHRLPFDSFYVSILSEKHKGSRFSILRGLLVGFISFLTSLFRIDRTSSLVYVFRKA